MLKSAILQIINDRVVECLNIWPVQNASQIIWIQSSFKRFSMHFCDRHVTRLYLQNWNNKHVWIFKWLILMSKIHHLSIWRHYLIVVAVVVESGIRSDSNEVRIDGSDSLKNRHQQKRAKEDTNEDERHEDQDNDAKRTTTRTTNANPTPSKPKTHAKLQHDRWYVSGWTAWAVRRWNSS